MARLLVLSDLHLRASATGLVRGVRTRAGLDAALEDARRAGPFDRVILCGDLAEEARPATYATLRDLLPRGTPALVLAGNHDRLEPLHEAFGKRDEAPSCGFVDECGGWRLIGVDTLWRGRVRGRLGRAQLDWLSRALAVDERPVVLFLHHPPVRVGTRWLDMSRLADARGLGAVLERAAHVRLVIHGHVHMPSDSTMGEARVLGMPSTAFQFTPGSILPRRGAATAGYRIIELGERDFQTEVRYVGGRP